MRTRPHYDGPLHFCQASASWIDGFPLELFEVPRYPVLSKKTLKTPQRIQETLEKIKIKF